MSLSVSVLSGLDFRFSVFKYNIGSVANISKSAVHKYNLPLHSHCTGMLLWFCDQDVVDRVAGGGQLVEETEVEAQPDCIPDEVVDNDISSLEQFFTASGWNLVQQAGKYSNVN